MDLPNTIASIGSVVGAKLATLHELETVYGVEDLYMMLEIHAVDGFNRYVANQPKK